MGFGFTSIGFGLGSGLASVFFCNRDLQTPFCLISPCGQRCVTELGRHAPLWVLVKPGLQSLLAAGTDGGRLEAHLPSSSRIWPCGQGFGKFSPGTQSLPRRTVPTEQGFGLLSPRVTQIPSAFLIWPGRQTAPPIPQLPFGKRGWPFGQALVSVRGWHLPSTGVVPRGQGSAPELHCPLDCRV